MRLLKDILYTVAIRETHFYDGNRDIAMVCSDSRKVSKGDLFIAIQGTQSDGHQYINQVIDKGAIAIVCSRMPDQLKDGVTYVLVQNTALALGQIAHNFYGNPSEKLMVVGITGTNGKTTTATLLFRLFRLLGHSCGLISTVQNQIDDNIFPTALTTPDALSIATLMHEMVKMDCTYCFMEVSSIAVDQHRIAGIKFKGGVFTNLTHDHLDYHKTFANYRDCKKAFFDNLNTEAFALTNADDENGAFMLQNTKARRYAYSLRNISDFNAKVLENSFDGLVLQVSGYELHSLLVGQFNAYNILSVFATAILLGEQPLNILAAISTLKPADGRFETIKSNQNIRAIIDYAHTPDALEQVLQTITKLRTGNEQVITVVGCGGNRDKEKRPIMARIAAKLSDKVILTSDNPRDEDPQTIIAEMQAGVKEYSIKRVLTITDRNEAIKAACLLANANDIILIAGKGHEKYQDIRGVKYPFDDKQVVADYLLNNKDYLNNFNN